MDIEKLVEDGARAFCRSGKFESGQGTCSLLCMEFLGDVRKTGCGHSARLHGPLAHAVLAIALRALERDALAEQRRGRTAIFLDELIENYRTLAAQLGGDNG